MCGDMVTVAQSEKLARLGSPQGQEQRVSPVSLLPWLVSSTLACFFFLFFFSCGFGADRFA